MHFASNKTAATTARLAGIHYVTMIHTSQGRSRWTPILVKRMTRKLFMYFHIDIHYHKQESTMKEVIDFQFINKDDFPCGRLEKLNHFKAFLSAV